MQVTVTPIPAKILIRSPLAPDCDFELRVERDLTSDEWDTLFDYLMICRRSADRASDPDALTGTADDQIPRSTVDAMRKFLRPSDSQEPQ